MTVSEKKKKEKKEQRIQCNNEQQNLEALREVKLFL